jgi:hypothetical protein
VVAGSTWLIGVIRLLSVALVHWEKTGEKTKDKVNVDLPKCEEETTASTAPPTTAPPTTARRRA